MFGRITRLEERIEFLSDEVKRVNGLLLYGVGDLRERVGAQDVEIEKLKNPCPYKIGDKGYGIFAGTNRSALGVIIGIKYEKYYGCRYEYEYEVFDGEKKRWFTHFEPEKKK